MKEMKFAFFTILFGGTILIIAIAFPLNGFSIPANPVKASLGLTEVNEALIQLTAKLNALSVGIKVFTAIVPFTSDSFIAALPDFESELEDLTSGLNGIGSSLSETSAVVADIKQRPGKGDEATLYDDLHNIAVNLNAVSSAVSEIGLSVANVKDAVQLADVNVQQLSESLTEAYDNTIAIKNAIDKLTQALDQFADNEGEKYAGWFKTTITSSGVTTAFSICASAISDMSGAVATKIPKSGTAAGTVMVLSIAINNLSENISELAATNL